VTLCLSYWKTVQLFSSVHALFYIPFRSRWGFRYLCIFTHVILSFDYSHLNVCEVGISSWFLSVFLLWLRLNIFSFFFFCRLGFEFRASHLWGRHSTSWAFHQPPFLVLINYFCIFFWEIAIQFFCLIFGLFVILLLSYKSSLYILNTKP
jgi:hypothetical protein